MEGFATISQNRESAHNVCLSVLVGYKPLDSTIRLGQFLANKTIKVANSVFDCIEFRDGLLGRWLLSHTDCNHLIAVEYDDDILNIPPFVLAAANQSNLSTTANEIAAALHHDCGTKPFSKISIAVSWPYEGIVVTISISGNSIVVAELLAGIPRVVDVTSASSAWIEPLKALVSKISDRYAVSDDYSTAVDPSGILELPHVDDEGKALRPSRMWIVRPASS
jgi:hypothetical protein